MRYFILSVLLVMLACPVLAGEISLLGGYGVTNNPTQRASAWQVEYTEGLGEHFAWSLSYLNQGHFVEHHRDGNAVNLWVRASPFHPQLSLAAGAGAVFYYDTIIPSSGAPASDFHGWGTMVNVAANWYTKSRFVYELRGSWVKGGQSFDTVSVLAGIGYQLDAPSTPGPLAKAPPQTELTTNNELTVFGGETVVNIPAPAGSGRSRAIALEYRRGLWRYVELTVGALYEGRNALIDRYGLTTQLWLAKPFFHDHLALGAGLGGYFAIDSRRGNGGHGDVFVSEIASLTGSYRISQHWHIRATWDRVISSYDRDTDIFLGGIGYRF
ncbi:hypothetical protein [Geobacter sp.]|uniref:hypothetical protein n=1 Tax=Geobacter sp. TaxID=46610 RepID=UPI002614D80E|nr:hypothetical protein [Geobacter sp.]